MSEVPREMELFLGALEREGEERERWLASIEDGELERRVRKLLSAHDELGTGEPAPLPLRAFSLDPEQLVGVEVDGYRITRVIGRGGMGIVFEAEQREPKRKVALKTLPASTATAEGMRRLELEARLLARLAHPGIAPIYASGRSAALGGLPYLVMELIEGVSVDLWAKERKPSLSELLRLLAEVADAVAHAHLHGIVHRDLKPANILVDANERPRVLDFGIARLDRDQELSLSLRTRTGQILGTLAYLSPEQIAGDPDAVDARSDVYALGVLAYELLSGHSPIDVQGIPLGTALRRIAELEPRPLGSIHRPLRGDLEVVVAKALEKNPLRRYESASALAADLRAVREHRAVAARAPSRLYLLRKSARRYRAWIAAASLSFASLFGGLLWALHARDEALRAEAEAAASAARETQRARSMRRLNDVLAEILALATPQKNGGEAPRLDEVLENFAPDVRTRYADDPYVRGHLLLFLADAHGKMLRLDEARSALADARSSFAASPLTRDEDRIALALAAADLGLAYQRDDFPLEELRSALQLASSLPEGRWEESRIAQRLAQALAQRREHLDEAEALARRGLEIDRELRGERSLTIASDWSNLGFLLSQTDRLSEAIEAHENALSIRREREPGSFALAKSLQNLGQLYSLTGRFDAAIEVGTEALELQRAILGDAQHPQLAFALDNLGCLLRDRGRFDEALALFAEAEAIFRGAPGQHQRDLAICLSEAGSALRLAGRAAEARSKLEEARELHAAHERGPSAAAAATFEHLALSLLSLGELEAALEAASTAEELRRAVHGERHHLVGRALEVLSAIHAARGDRDALELVTRELHELRLAHYGPDHWITWHDVPGLVSALVARGAEDEARSLIARCAEVLGRALPEHHEARRAAERLRATLHAPNESSGR
ncbi:MAG: serine/threonine protein kinase [Planctomycetes bacterium]|nr:serine/threonine protein kinase [Planctomycetota bacterium]